MSSGWFSLPQSFSQGPAATPSQAQGFAQGHDLSARSASTKPDFASFFAPKQQNLRTHAESTPPSRTAGDSSRQMESATSETSSRSSEADTGAGSSSFDPNPNANTEASGSTQDPASTESPLGESGSDANDSKAPRDTASAEVPRTSRESDASTGKREIPKVSAEQNQADSYAPDVEGDLPPSEISEQPADETAPAVALPELNRTQSEPVESTKSNRSGRAETPQLRPDPAATSEGEKPTGEGRLNETHTTQRVVRPTDEQQGREPVRDAGREPSAQAAASRGEVAHAQNGQRSDDEPAEERPREHRPQPERTETPRDPETRVREMRDDTRAERRAEQRADGARSVETEHSSAPANRSASEHGGALRLENLGASDRAVSASAARPEAGTSRPDADDQNPTARSVARGMNAVLRQGGGSLTMRLSPATLGEVRIEMSMQGGRVSVQFDVGSVAAYEAIRGQVSELRQSLEQRGMTVERVETHISPALARSAQSESGSQQRSGDQPNSGDPNQSRHDAADGESRGRADAEGREQRADRSQWSSSEGESFETNFEQAVRLGLDAVA